MPVLGGNPKKRKSGGTGCKGAGKLGGKKRKSSKKKKKSSKKKKRSSKKKKRSSKK